jgi:hypothetical protein
VEGLAVAAFKVEALAEVAGSTAEAVLTVAGTGKV